MDHASFVRIHVIHAKTSHFFLKRLQLLRTGALTQLSESQRPPCKMTCVTRRIPSGVAKRILGRLPSARKFQPIFIFDTTEEKFVTLCLRHPEMPGGRLLFVPLKHFAKLNLASFPCKLDCSSRRGTRVRLIPGNTSRIQIASKLWLLPWGSFGLKSLFQVPCNKLRNLREP